MTDLPRRGIARSARLAQVPLGVAGRTARGWGQRLGGRSAEEVTAEQRRRTAEQLFTVLGNLKGGAMKVGQQLSVLEAAFPEDLAEPFRDALTRLQDAAPPMPAETVHEILATELGPRWGTTKFASFDDTPAAAASIGQVHKATWRDGRSVAVKVQYPGAGEALRSDLRQIARLARVTAGWVPGLDVKPITDELTATMTQELDYDQEAANQRLVARAFRDDPEFVVPEVLAHAEHVLVSEWVDGVPVSRIIREGSPAVRAAVAQKYFDFLLVGPERSGVLHADPHPGNFRITPEGQLAIIDFGAVHPLPGGVPPIIGELVRAALDGDAETVHAGLTAEGFVRRNVTVDPDELLRYVTTFLEPLRHDRFTFSRDWMRDVAAVVQDPKGEAFRTGLKLNLPPQYLMIQRVWLGAVGVLCQLESEIEVREPMERWIPGLAPTD